jgi:hypothetical protein
MMKMNLDFLSLTPGFSQVKAATLHRETVLTVWMCGRKSLKWFQLVGQPDTWLNPGANEILISL